MLVFEALAQHERVLRADGDDQTQGQRKALNQRGQGGDADDGEGGHARSLPVNRSLRQPGAAF